MTDATAEPSLPLDPTAVAEPDRAAEPGRAGKPNVVTTPHLVAEPNRVAEPDPVTEPDLVTATDPVTKPDPVGEPDPVGAPDLVTEPDPVTAPDRPDEPDPVTEPTTVGKLDRAAEPKEVPDPTQAADTDPFGRPYAIVEPNTVAELDVVAIGCGPFNLGLAALASTMDNLTIAVLEAEPELNWHPGLLFDDALLQVSFLADLVSLVDPTHPLSFLAYLRDRDRLYRFYVRERFHPTRVEYQDYLRWAAARLPSVRFGHRVTDVRWDGTDGRFAVCAERPDGTSVLLRAPNVVLGIGTTPAMPACLTELPAERVLHSSTYLHRRGDIDAHDAVTIVGSGQSGAEVALDLLRRNTSSNIAWLTRTGAFAPLDYTKLVLEMTTPAYVSHFHGLPEQTRDALVAAQWRHYKGISTETVEELHDLLYRRELAGAPPTLLRVGTAVESATVGTDGRVVLTCRDTDTGAVFTHRTGIVVAATGYRERPAGFLTDVAPLLHRDAAGRLVVGADHAVATDETVTGRVFVANADLHSHGVAAPDLGIGAVRNATILNTVTGRPVYPLPVDTAFTTFGLTGR